ncbi:winged helix-turn-helix transcriptional regulator [Streptomyces mayonensis]|uniref:winged helix-turn-helix transcriptional regulator n=1 Tax=Streptomyces mayonensis TaxID=2750816 RepID=UPI001C1E89B4|nr:helix-turn-helix domain-containing protein [Streptomyces sp. A108]MBU6530736.1 helix-turn-helix transcriptional regulator [Streptomyces sp. A108]
MEARSDGAQPAVPPGDACRTRVVLDIVGDKWSLLVVRNLRHGPRRFTELYRTIDGISRRMLTVTLRSLERDGILTRTVHNVMPPHVSYELTEMGVTLREATAPLLEWSVAHLGRIDDARAAYDARPEQPGTPPVG